MTPIHRATGSQERRTGNGRRKTEKGRRRMDNARWPMENRPPPDGPLSPPTCYLPRRAIVSMIALSKMTVSSHKDWCLI